MAINKSTRADGGLAQIFISLHGHTWNSLLNMYRVKAFSRAHAASVVYKTGVVYTYTHISQTSTVPELCSSQNGIVELLHVYSPKNYNLSTGSA